MTDPGSHSHINAQLVNAFLGLQLTGGLGLALIVLTALGSRNVKRNSTWYTFCLAWILSCISYTLVFLVGQQDSPDFGICVTQAAGIFSAPALCNFQFVLIGVRAASGNIPPNRRYSTTLVVGTEWDILPYRFFQSVHPNLRGSPQSFTSFGTVYIGTRLFRSRKLLKDRQMTRMAVRVMVFSSLSALGLGVGVAFVLYPIRGPLFDILLADLINVWFFWRRPLSEAKTDELKSPSIYVATPRFERRAQLLKFELPRTQRRRARAMTR
ncbi:hypothetical protein DFH09DRAFT_1289581 [Mycena vulgaris]|nr:hypothetical protein DFH09DRAFT_1289581 [Mycena vulgaris]